MGITAKVIAQELPEYGHYVLSFVDNFWQICGINKVAEPFCVQTGPDVENVIVPTNKPTLNSHNRSSNILIICTSSRHSYAPLQHNA